MEDPLLGTAVLGLHNKDEWVVHTVQLCNNPLFSFFFNSSQSEKPLRVQIAKVHLPTGFSWNELYEKKIKDLAVIELMTDVQFSPKVKIIKNVNVHRCCLSAFLLQRVLRFQVPGGFRFQFLIILTYTPVFLGEPGWGKGNNNGMGRGKCNPPGTKDTVCKWPLTNHRTPIYTIM